MRPAKARQPNGQAPRGHWADPSRWSALALHALALSAVLGLLGLAQQMWRLRQPGWALGLLLAAGLLLMVQCMRRLQAWRYVLPGVLAVLVFVVLPMGFTVAIGLTNYSSQHLLDFDRATRVLLERTDSRGLGMDIALHRTGPAPDAPLQAWLHGDDGRAWVSAPFEATAQGADRALAQPGAALAAAAPPARPRIALREAGPDDTARGRALTARELVARLPALQALDFHSPDGLAWRLASLHRVSDQSPRYQRIDAATLRDLTDGRPVRADHAAGQWRDAEGRALEPGFRTAVGLDNYRRIFGDARFFGPFARVFAWTLAFAALNTLLTFGLGLLLAVALNWEALRGKAFYRVALFLPYAVPAFISIPIFRGLFNENLGEINLVLDLLLGIRPGWFSDATLARSMVLVVNTWLGYPYMMILAMGLLKAIPEDLYEASAMAGAGPLDNLRRITLPLVARPMAPLLIASFATNFNNLTLIALLTEGAPDYLDTDVPVGATDLLASYTYRIAFSDGGQNFALACAISTLVFAIVALLAVVNLRLFGARR
ncbi:maltose ABC transporter permease MalF [Aquabacterium sp. OR-4]|uniref:maltose ABC transporter permease MalF n=1 Tax=Aquabacterium sp. OR-4 TaxID=2978127 RepID=UPI0021B48C08|nr:maltose ABC transporter permease MalF [Aquabacterium sp. OR-4]MDT7838481.1 maltose ABC transporter permease MalF [Aquabacterium sp. OR-4]